MPPEVLYDVRDHVATVTLNRPERANAATIDMGELLQQHVRAADLDDDVRVLVLTGSGEAFCAGDDVEGAWGDPRMATILAGLADARPPLTPEVQALLECRKPVIAAVNGLAVGSGMDMALAADIRLASDRARFAQAYVRMGLMADVLGYWRLPQLIGPGPAAELLFTGDIIGAADAERLGLVNRVVAREALADEVESLATRIAANPPIAVRYIKEGLRRGAGRPVTELPEIAAFVGNGLSRLFGTKDHQEAVAAFTEKRSPQFANR